MSKEPNKLFLMFFGLEAVCDSPVAGIWRSVLASNVSEEIRLWLPQGICGHVPQVDTPRPGGLLSQRLVLFAARMEESCVRERAVTAARSSNTEKPIFNRPDSRIT